ncbi:hypothetical protein J6590_065747 [Homalodisca vitripennis]|nr:hypothetical protein J6590_065747 [Homalodisca vitripennis]
MTSWLTNHGSTVIEVFDRVYRVNRYSLSRFLTQHPYGPAQRVGLHSSSSRLQEIDFNEWYVRRRETDFQISRNDYIT